MVVSEPVRGGGGSTSDGEEEEEEEQESRSIVDRARDSASGAVDRVSETVQRASGDDDADPDDGNDGDGDADGDSSDDRDDESDGDDGASEERTSRAREFISDFGDRMDRAAERAQEASDQAKETKEAEETADELRDRAGDAADAIERRDPTETVSDVRSRAGETLSRLRESDGDRQAIDDRDIIDGSLEAGRVGADPTLGEFGFDELESDFESDVASELDGVDEDDIDVDRRDGELVATFAGSGQEVATLSRDDIAAGAASQLDEVGRDDVRARETDDGFEIGLRGSAQESLIRDQVAADDSIEREDVRLEREGDEFAVELTGESALNQFSPSEDAIERVTGGGSIGPIDIPGARSSPGEIREGVIQSRLADEADVSEDAVALDFDSGRATIRGDVVEDELREEAADDLGFAPDQIDVREDDGEIVAEPREGAVADIPQRPAETRLESVRPDLDPLGRSDEGTAAEQLQSQAAAASGLSPEAFDIVAEDGQLTTQVDDDVVENELREETADEFDVEPDDVEIEQDGDEFVARVDDGDDGLRLPSRDEVASGARTAAVAPFAVTGAAINDPEGTAEDLASGARDAGTTAIATPYVLTGRSIQRGEEIVSEPVETTREFEDSTTEREREIAALGAAGVAAPEPTSTVGGTLALLGVGALATNELVRDEEIGLPTEQDRSEVAVGNPNESVEELSTPVSESVSEIGVPDSTSVVETEIETPGEQTVADPGLIQTGGAVVDQPTPGENIISPEQPTIDRPEPEIDERPTEREFPTGESAVVGRVGQEVETQPGELDPAVGEDAAAPTLGGGFGTVGVVAGSASEPRLLPGGFESPGNEIGVGNNAEEGALSNLTPGVGVDVSAGFGSEVGLQTQTETATPSETLTEQSFGFENAFETGTVGSRFGARETGRFNFGLDGSDDSSETQSEREIGGSTDRRPSDRPLEAGWLAETIEGFAFGGFRETEISDVEDVPATGEIPTATLADPTDEEAEALGDVGGVFGFDFGGRDESDGRGLL